MTSVRAGRVPVGRTPTTEFLNSLYHNRQLTEQAGSQSRAAVQTYNSSSEAIARNQARQRSFYDQALQQEQNRLTQAQNASRNRSTYATQSFNPDRPVSGAVATEVNELRSGRAASTPTPATSRAPSFTSASILGALNTGLTALAVAQVGQQVRNAAIDANPFIPNSARAPLRHITGTNPADMAINALGYFGGDWLRRRLFPNEGRTQGPFPGAESPVEGRREPPFSGGQSNGVAYKVQIKIQSYTSNSGTQTCDQRSSISDVGGFWGPIGGVRTTQPGTLNLGWCSGKPGFQTIQIFSRGPSWAGISSNSYWYTVASASTPSYISASVSSVSRLDGQPDTGGNPAPLTDAPLLPAVAPLVGNQLQVAPQRTPSTRTQPTGTPTTSPAAPTAPPNLAPAQPRDPLAPATPLTPRNPLAPATPPTPQQNPQIADQTVPPAAPAAPPPGSSTLNNLPGGPLSPQRLADRALPMAIGTLLIPPALGVRTGVPTIVSQNPRSTTQPQPGGGTGTGTGTGTQAPTCLYDNRNIKGGVDQANGTLNGLNTFVTVDMWQTLQRVDNKLGDQIPGGIGGFLKKFWDSLALNKILSVLTYLAVIHNAMMLSNSVAQSLFFAADRVFEVLGVQLKDSNDQQIDVSQWVGSKIEDFAKSIFGDDTVDEVQLQWKKWSTIYRAAANIVNAVQDMMSSVINALEVIGRYVSKIGNALKKWGAVAENAYDWMTPNMNFRQGKFWRVLDATQETAEAVETVASEILSAREQLQEIGSHKQELDTQLQSEVAAQLQAQKEAKKAMRDTLPAIPENAEKKNEDEDRDVLADWLGNLPWERQADKKE